MSFGTCSNWIRIMCKQIYLRSNRKYQSGVIAVRRYCILPDLREWCLNSRFSCVISRTPILCGAKSFPLCKGNSQPILIPTKRDDSKMCANQQITEFKNKFPNFRILMALFSFYLALIFVFHIHPVSLTPWVIQVDSCVQTGRKRRKFYMSLKFS